MKERTGDIHIFKNQCGPTATHVLERAEAPSEPAQHFRPQVAASSELEQRFRTRRRLPGSPRIIFECHWRLRGSRRSKLERKERFRASWSSDFDRQSAAPSQLEQRIRAHRRPGAARAVNSSVLFDSTVFSSCRKNAKGPKHPKPASARAEI